MDAGRWTVGLLMSSLSLAFADAPIPRNLASVGWELGTAGANMRVEIYGDFQCPDTKATWEGWLSQFRAQHQHEASIIFHPFPLPYHKNGFDAAQAATVVTMLGGNFSRIADALFAGQAAFQTDATINMSQADVFKAVLAPIAAKAGIKPSDFLPRMTNSDPSNEQVRGAWKLGAASGVSGTPAFAANSAISDELVGWDLDKWNAWMTAGVGKK